MELEPTIFKEVTNIRGSIEQLSSLVEVIEAEAPAGDFHTQFRDLLTDIIASYRVVTDNLSPLCSMPTAEAFERSFAGRFECYAEHCGAEISKPRENAEETFNKYLQFRKLAVVRTKYPVLQRAFAEFHAYVDKWVDNDVWLAMSIDVSFKLLLKWMSRIKETKARDAAAAFADFSAFISTLSPHVVAIEENLRKLQQGSGCS